MIIWKMALGKTFGISTQRCLVSAMLAFLKGMMEESMFVHMIRENLVHRRKTPG